MQRSLVFFKDYSCLHELPRYNDILEIILTLKVRAQSLSKSTSFIFLTKNKFGKYKTLYCYSCLLQNATIEYSSESVCVCVCFCTITQKLVHPGI